MIPEAVDEYDFKVLNYSNQMLRQCPVHCDRMGLVSGKARCIRIALHSLYI